jgi:hypothetical protein
MRATLPCLCAGLLLSGFASAQRLVAFDPAAAAVDELQPVTPLVPGPVPPLAAYPTVPPLPVVPSSSLALPGDSTFDNRTGLLWYSNGLALAAMPVQAFPPMVVVPPVPLPIPLPVLAAIGGGPVTGIAMNPLGNVMYLCGDAGIVVGVTPIPGLPIVAPPIPIPFPTPLITGLEWDGSSNSLIACDWMGTCYQFLPTGAPIGAPIVSVWPLPAPAGDVAIDKTLRLNGVGRRPIYVVGSLVVDITDPGSPPFFSTFPFAQGLAFVDHPAANPPAGTCLCPGTTYPTQFTTGPMAAGNGLFGIGMGGMPAGWPVLWIFDVLTFNPGFPLVNGVGCGLGLVLGSPGLILFGGAADPFGNAVLPLPMVPPSLPLGAGPFYNQNVTICPTDPVLGLVLTPMQTIYAAGY